MMLIKNVKTRSRMDCESDRNALIAKMKLKLKSPDKMLHTIKAIGAEHQQLVPG